MLSLFEPLGECVASGVLALALTLGLGLEGGWDKIALTWALVLPPVDGLEAGAEAAVWTCDSGLAGRRLRSEVVSVGESRLLLLSLSPLSTPSIELAPSITIPCVLPPSRIPPTIRGRIDINIALTADPALSRSRSWRNIFVGEVARGVVE